jgi:hypothetical protein
MTPARSAWRSNKLSSLDEHRASASAGALFYSAALMGCSFWTSCVALIRALAWSSSIANLIHVI